MVANAAREANAIIDQRAFSWTELFAQFEATLPPTCGSRPCSRGSSGWRLHRRRSRSKRAGAEDLDAFIEALEMTGAFHDVLSTRNRPATTG